MDERAERAGQQNAASSGMDPMRSSVGLCSRPVRGWEARWSGGEGIVFVRSRVSADQRLGGWGKREEGEAEGEA